MSPKKKKIITPPKSTVMQSNKENKSPSSSSALAVNRKEYYLVLTSIHFPRATKEYDLEFVQSNSKPQLFSNEKKAQDYMKEKAEKLKDLFHAYADIIMKEEKESGSEKMNNKNKERNLDMGEYYEESLNQIVLGVNKAKMFSSNGNWGFLKFDKVVLNGVLPVIGVGRRVRPRTEEEEPSSSAA